MKSQRSPSQYTNTFLPLKAHTEQHIRETATDGQETVKELIHELHPATIRSCIHLCTYYHKYHILSSWYYHTHLDHIGWDWPSWVSVHDLWVPAHTPSANPHLQQSPVRVVGNHYLTIHGTWNYLRGCEKKQGVVDGGSEESKPDEFTRLLLTSW